MFPESPIRKKTYQFMGGLFIIAALTTVVISQLFAASSLSFNITVTFLDVTPTPQGTPVVEHFRLSGNPHGGWFNAYNAQIVGDGTGKVDVTYTGSGTGWGYVTSNTFSDFDIDSYPNVRVVITDVTSGTGNEIWVNDGSGPSGRIRIDGGYGLGAGEYDFNVKTLTGWSTPKSFFFELVVNGAAASQGTRFDELWSYNQNSNGLVEHFRLSGNPHPGWFNAYNAQIVGDGSGKADVTYTGSGTGWGYVTSNTYSNFDIDSYPNVRVVITDVTSGTGNEIWVNDGSGPSGRIRIDGGYGLGAGEYDFNVKTLTGWSTPKSFFFELVVNGAAAGQGTRFDELKLGSAP